MAELIIRKEFNHDSTPRIPHSRRALTRAEIAEIMRRARIDPAAIRLQAARDRGARLAAEAQEYGFQINSPIHSPIRIPRSDVLGRLGLDGMGVYRQTSPDYVPTNPGPRYPPTSPGRTPPRTRMS